MTSSAPNSSSRLLAELAVELNEQGWHDLVEQVPASAEEDPIRIAFVGPYNGGKSSLIAALTRDLTIARSGKPESYDARRYRWQDGIELVDLPGWFSGFNDHDNHADEELRRSADLVAFVLTVELGDERIVDAIDRVLGTLGFADRSVVVVNKSLSEDSDPDIIREEVVRRLGRHDAVPVYNTDAQSFLDTISGEFDFDDESVQILTESSGIDELSCALAEMVRRHGISARTVAQSRQGARVADEALSRLVPDAVERATIDQLDELQAAIGDAKDRLDRLASWHLSRLESGISAIADRVLADPKLSDTEHDLAWEAACQPSNALADDANKVLAELSETLGGIAVALDPSVSDRAPARPSSGGSQPQAGQRALGPRVLDAMGIDVSWAADVVAKASKKVAQEGAEKGSIAYELARKLQPKKVFKPYGRLKDAAQIRRGAEWLGKANVAIPALEEVWGWWNETNEFRAVERSKKEVRQRYGNAARAEAKRVMTEFDDWRHESLAPYEEQLRAGRAPLDAVAAERETTRQAITALRDRLLEELASTSADWSWSWSGSVT